MAKKTKSEIKLNKKHEGKEFSSNFHYVGVVKPVRKKNDDSDSWFDVEIFDTNVTKTQKDRRVLQFNIETAFKNELKVELAGMEKDTVYLYSSTERKSAPISWADRFDKSKYPNDTYHLIETEWDKTERLAKLVKPGVWVEVKGKYEFSTFENNEGKEITSVRRMIEYVAPLKNGEVVITGLKEGEVFRAYDSEVDGNYLGMGKADKEGTVTVRVGWLNPEGGTLYICKVENDTEGKRTKVDYTDGTSSTDRITVNNNVDSSVRVEKVGGTGYEYVTYVRNFRDENFREINKFEMQLGIKSTYQDEKTLDTKVNGVFLDYGKDKSVPRDVELMVYYKEAAEGNTPFATAFGRLNRGDFLVVEGIDNNRAEFALVEVQEVEEDNPFADVAEKVSDFEQVSTGTKKGLEILQYYKGTYKKKLLTEDEMVLTSSSNDPFADTSIGISEDDLPF